MTCDRQEQEVCIRIWPKLPKIIQIFLQIAGLLILNSWCAALPDERLTSMKVAIDYLTIQETDYDGCSIAQKDVPADGLHRETDKQV